MTKQALVWVVEVRDSRDQDWRFWECRPDRAGARAFREVARETHAFTRIRKYIREAA